MADPRMDGIPLILETPDGSFRQLFPAVVMQLYGEYDSRTNGRNDVGDDQRPVFKHD